MKAYLAGKITGDSNYKSKFEEAERRLQNEGFTVMSPAVLPEGMSSGDYMRICFAMLDSADVVAFMPCYEQSKGAMLEWSYCQYISKQTYYLR